MRPSCIFFPPCPPSKLVQLFCQVLSPGSQGKEPPQEGEEQRSLSGRQSPSCSEKKNKRKLCWIFLFGCFGVFLIYMEVLWL